ncbi:TniQ family protein [Streptomyces albidoflavus]|nr:TniQ family protein [Streptomyces sp. CBG31]
MAPWRPPTALARRVYPIAGESTASFVGRLAALNHMPVDALMSKIGEGAQPMPVETTDVYLNAAALERLAALSSLDVLALQRALPHVREAHLLTDGPGPAWRWPRWQPRDPVFLVRACDLCAAARRRPAAVYLVSVTRWQVCGRHGRWLDNLREGGTTWLSLAALPEVVQAHEQRVLLERRVGAGGRTLFADALHIAAFWWNVPALCPPVWHERSRALGPSVGSDLRIAPLVAYPEVVALAWMLAARERRRMRNSWSVGQDGAWLNQVGGTFSGWRMPAGPAQMAVELWMRQHSGAALPTDTGVRPAQGKWRRLPAPLPHEDAPLGTHLEKLTCLPWRFGDEPPHPPDSDVWSVLGQA